MATGLFFLPRKYDSRDADRLALNFKALLFDVNQFGFQLASFAAVFALWATSLGATLVTVKATRLDLHSTSGHHCQSKDRQGDSGQ